MNNNLTILLYHGVTSAESVGIENYSKKHIDKDSFVSQMKFIKKKCNVVSMDEIIEIFENNKEISPNTVAVTFDDGFKNNYTDAAPVLEEFNIPSTFYITSGIINTDIMFWVDKLEDCINLCKKDKISIHLDEKREFYLRNKEDKINALNEIKTFCKKNNKTVKNIVIQDVIESTEVKPNVNHSENYKKLDWNELNLMNNNDLFTIGGHSLYHDILSQIKNTSKLELDIELSLNLLKYHLDTEIIHYSYPEGQSNHYNEEVIRILKQNGVICCPSAIDGVNSLKDDLFNLKRIMVGFMGRKFPF